MGALRAPTRTQTGSSDWRYAFGRLRGAVASCRLGRDGADVRDLVCFREEAQYMTREMELQLSEADSVSIGYVSDPYALLRAIDEAMPKDAILYVEGNSIVREIKDFLTSRQAGTPREIERGTTWPKPKTFHMLLEGTNLAELRALAEHHAAPEICDHLVVYRGDQVLLAAYDAGDNVVDVTKSLSQETVECLCEALGTALTERKPHGFLGRFFLRD